MYTTRLASTGIALATALALGLSGCAPTTDQNGKPHSTPSSSAPADPRVELTAALEQLNKQSSKFELDSLIINASGALYPLKMASDITVEMTAARTMRMVSSGDDLYLKFDGEQAADLPDKWLHLDMAKLDDDSDLRTMADDPGNVKALIKGIVTIDRTGPGNYAGILDFTTSVGEDSDLAKTFGDKATAVPFTATVDTDGRLTELFIDLTVLDVSLGQMRATYFDFGNPVTVRKPPASEVEEAPAEMLEAFGG